MLFFYWKIFAGVRNYFDAYPRFQNKFFDIASICKMSISSPLRFQLPDLRSVSSMNLIFETLHSKISNHRNPSLSRCSVFVFATCSIQWLAFESRPSARNWTRLLPVISKLLLRNKQRLFLPIRYKDNVVKILF